MSTKLTKIGKHARVEQMYRVGRTKYVTRPAVLIPLADKDAYKKAVAAEIDGLRALVRSGGLNGDPNSR